MFATVIEKFKQIRNRNGFPQAKNEDFELSEQAKQYFSLDPGARSNKVCTSSEKLNLGPENNSFHWTRALGQIKFVHRQNR